eukprot:6182032-Pleurochrysis_carterae.AAC.5
MYGHLLVVITYGVYYGAVVIVRCEGTGQCTCQQKLAHVKGQERCAQQAFHSALASLAFDSHAARKAQSGCRIARAPTPCGADSLAILLCQALALPLRPCPLDESLTRRSFTPFASLVDGAPVLFFRLPCDHTACNPLDPPPTGFKIACGILPQVAKVCNKQRHDVHNNVRHPAFVASIGAILKVVHRVDRSNRTSESQLLSSALIVGLRLVADRLVPAQIPAPMSQKPTKGTPPQAGRALKTHWQQVHRLCSEAALGAALRLLKPRSMTRIAEASEIPIMFAQH